MEMNSNSLSDSLFTSKFNRPGQGLSGDPGFVEASASDMRAQHVRDQETEASAVQESGTVLLVDDDSIFLEVTSVMLSRLGFIVFTAIDGVEAVAMFRRHQNEIGFVLCDVVMPRMNGWETLFALRQIKPDLMVILASGYSEERVMGEARSELPQAFLGKPFGFQALRDTIGRVLKETKE